MKCLIRYLILFSFVLPTGSIFGQVSIVVLGSSTAAGAGASHSDSSWVGRYRTFIQTQHPDNQVINLAKGGYTTFHILPTGVSTPTDRPNPDITRNITTALNIDPDAIIINLPSNDAANGFSVSEQLANYDAVIDKATAESVPVWLTTPQGRNLDLDGRQNLMAMRDSTFARYVDKTIDFWTYIGQSDGTLNIIYSSGDGIHLNDRGHNVLFGRVVEKDIPGQILSSINISQKIDDRPKIFPNPVDNLLSIYFPSPVDEEIAVAMTDMLGQQLGIYLMARGELHLQINTTFLTKGMYWLSFLRDKGQLRSKSVSFIKG